MPELSICLNTEDEWDVVRFVLSSGGYLVPDLDYDQPKYEIIDSEESYILYQQETAIFDSEKACTFYRRRATQFYILFEDYLESPLEMPQVRKEHSGKLIYYIGQRDGGPTIDLRCSNRFKRGDVEYIGVGNLAHYPWYWSTIREENLDAPEALKRRYKEIVKKIKEGSTRVKVHKRTYIVGKHATEELKRPGVELAVVAREREVEG